MSATATQLPSVLSGRSARAGAPARLWAHIGVRLHRARLDAILAEGADPAASPELQLRARQLTRPSHRQALAAGFEKALAAAEGPRPRFSSAVAPAKYEVRAARAALLELCQDLRERPTVAPAGMALARQLLTDGTSPLYIESRNDALWHALRRATAALDAHR